MPPRGTNNELCTIPGCQYTYTHYYDYGLCGRINATSRTPVQAPEEKTMPDPIHMIPHEFGTGCNIKLDDGKIHRVTSNFDTVTCDECKLRWLLYVKKEQEEKIADLSEELARQKEKVRVAEQATGMVRRDLHRATLRVGAQEKTIRALRQDIDYLRGGPQYYVDPVTGRTRRF